VSAIDPKTTNANKKNIFFMVLRFIINNVTNLQD
jgi:hypothetical protein